MHWWTAVAFLPLACAGPVVEGGPGAAPEPAATFAFVNLVTGPAQPRLGDPLPGAGEPVLSPPTAAPDPDSPPSSVPSRPRRPSIRNDALLV